MTDWIRLEGMVCTCPPLCTIGNVWGDGPRDCDPACLPCRLIRGTTYTKPFKAGKKKR